MSRQPKALYGHCVTVYHAMEEKGEPDEAFDGLVVYKGFLTKLFKELGLSVPYYTAILTELKRMDCIRQIKRGGGSSASAWLLLQPPDEILYEHSSGSGGKHTKSTIEQLNQRITDMNNRLSILESRYESA